jgi:hypothetical protein
MDSPRLPAALEVAALLRQTQAGGGFGMVLHKGDADSGAVLVVGVDREGLGTLYERLPDPDFTERHPRQWQQVRRQDPAERQAFDDYLDRRVQRDRDLWIIELTIADVERSILNPV